MVQINPDLSQASKELAKLYQSMYSQLNPQAQSLIRNKLEEKTGIKFL